MPSLFIWHQITPSASIHVSWDQHNLSNLGHAIIGFDFTNVNSETMHMIPTCLILCFQLQNGVDSFSCIIESPADYSECGQLIVQQLSEKRNPVKTVSWMKPYLPCHAKCYQSEFKQKTTMLLLWSCSWTGSCSANNTRLPEHVLYVYVCNSSVCR